MKRALVLFLTLAIALPVHVSADERTVKKQLIAELLGIIDTKALTQASFDLAFERLGDSMGDVGDLELDDEQKKEFEERARKQKEQMTAFRDRLYTRIDYARYAEEVYAPLFDKNFTADELRELIAFYQTKPGQKTARMLPDFALGGFIKGMELLQDTARIVEQEMRDEDRKKNPWKATLADLRSLATAVEARATDTEDYPKVSSVDELEPLITPTYIREVPKADGWGTKFSFVSDGKSYRIASAGADKRFEWNAKQLENLPAEFPTRYTEGEDADIIYQDGNLVQAPKKAQKDNDY
ncbi:MAG TPA: DUF2059 domain-containing protein [Thermoanaerobaculia bacterium]